MMVASRRKKAVSLDGNSNRRRAAEGHAHEDKRPARHTQIYAGQGSKELRS